MSKPEIKTGESGIVLAVALILLGIIVALVLQAQVLARSCLNLEKKRLVRIQLREAAGDVDASREIIAGHARRVAGNRITLRERADGGFAASFDAKDRAGQGQDEKRPISFVFFLKPLIISLNF